MSCITKILELKGDKEFLPLHDQVVIEGGGTHKGFEYLITFTHYGTRCGYVAVSPDFKYNTDDISVHGGVTFEGEDHGAKNLLPMPCSDIWIGFDAAHWGDMRDFDKAKKYFGQNEKEMRGINLMEEIHKEVDELERQDPSFSHKTYDYMVDQCKSVIEQLIEQAA